MSARVHLRNLAFNWGGHAATLVVMFFLSPYIVGKLDAVTYGIWSLLNVLTGYMGIFDLGVRASVGRHVALYLGKDDPVGVDETIRAGFGFFSMAGGLILLAGIGLGWLFPVLFKGVSPEHYSTVRVLLPLMVVNVWLSAIAAIYSSVLAAHDRFDVARGVDMIVLLVRTVCTIYVLERGWGLWGLVFAVIAGNLCAVIGNRIFAGRVHSGLRSVPFLYSRERLKELFGYGFPAFITNASVKIIGQSDLVLVGLLFSVASVREYSVGAMLVYYCSSFVAIIGRTLFPAIQRAVSGGTPGEVKHLFFRQVHLTLSFGILVYIGLAIYSQPFIKLWMFQDNFDMDAVQSASNIMAILAFSKLVSLYVPPCNRVLSAMGHVKITATLTMIESLVNVAMSLFFVLVYKFGIEGIALGTLSTRFIIPCVFSPLYFCKKIEIRYSVFIRSIIIPMFIATITFCGICFLLLYLVDIQTWLTFVVIVFLSFFSWFFVVAFTVLPKDYTLSVKKSLKILCLI